MRRFVFHFNGIYEQNENLKWLLSRLLLYKLGSTVLRCILHCDLCIVCEYPIPVWAVNGVRGAFIGMKEGKRISVCIDLAAALDQLYNSICIACISFHPHQYEPISERLHASVCVSDCFVCLFVYLLVMGIHLILASSLTVLLL